MKVELNCAVCGHTAEVYDIEMPQLELLLDQWTTKHTHTDEQLAEWRDAELKMQAEWRGHGEETDD